MRISDWSSDVCSSDLLRFGFRHALHAMRAGFVLELRINAEAEDARNDFLEAAVLTFVGGQDFDLPSTRFRVLAVHSVQVTGEDRRLVAAGDRKRTRLKSSHYCESRMPSSA